MKVVVINENYVDKSGLVAEHGLSLLLEIEDKVLLFDTGQSVSLENNLRILNPKCNKIDYIILSHGHYDHTGGLYKNRYYLKDLCNKVIASKYVFDKHLRKTENNYDFIGFKDNVKEDFEFLFVEDSCQLSENIFIYGNIKRFEDFLADKRFFCEIDNKIVKDPFRDELYLLIKDGGKNILITGCSHAGIMNIVKDCFERAGIDRLDYLIGGMHLFRSDLSYVEKVGNFLQDEAKVENVITGHCTGLDNYYYLKNNFHINLSYLKTGEQFIL
ncbi:MBL fold metallo-hydrolase [Deferribacter thermophilus]|uniref:MBL fold metallo-hydrolase n=1 Tax=Deferribacter thermophilus TaxID=53573 RepID=UPI003C1EECBE